MKKDEKNQASQIQVTKINLVEGLASMIVTTQLPQLSRMLSMRQLSLLVIVPFGSQTLDVLLSRSAIHKKARICRGNIATHSRPTLRLGTWASSTIYHAYSTKHNKSIIFHRSVYDRIVPSLM